MKEAMEKAEQKEVIAQEATQKVEEAMKKSWKYAIGTSIGRYRL
jgi:hypothetical protein